MQVLHCVGQLTAKVMSFVGVTRGFLLSGARVRFFIVS